MAILTLQRGSTQTKNIMARTQNFERDIVIDSATDITSKLKNSAVALSMAAAGRLDFKLQVCTRILSGDFSDLTDEALLNEFRNATLLHRHYLVGALYMLLMPRERRQRLAAFFTPPHLSEYVLNQLHQYGLDFKKHSILDPACGGAAFLAPTAQRIASSLRARKASPSEIVEQVSGLVRGVEIEPSLARLSQLMIEDVVRPEIENTSQHLHGMVIRANSLKHQFDQKFDAVISNPPYGRVFKPSKKILDRWSQVISDGHVNTYALFTSVALENLREGGLAALVIPTSFTGGPYFEALRKYISREAEILEVGLIEKREKVFLDVVQDTCVVFLKKNQKTPPRIRHITKASLIDASGDSKSIGSIEILPETHNSLWVLPRSNDKTLGESSIFFRNGLSNLTDLGFVVRSGYFVWNRSRDRLFNRNDAGPDEVPLVWAHNVKAGLPIQLSPGPLRGIQSSCRMSCVTISKSNSALITTKSLILQRTTNRNQSRRLVAGIINDDLLKQHGAFVSENHTIVISQLGLVQPRISAELLLKLLNSNAVDSRYRQISGTVSISAKLLRILPLPDPEALVAALQSRDDFEEAVELAYQRS